MTKELKYLQKVNVHVEYETIHFKYLFAVRVRGVIVRSCN